MTGTCKLQDITSELKLKVFIFINLNLIINVAYI